MILTFKEFLYEGSTSAKMSGKTIKQSELRSSSAKKKLAKKLGVTFNEVSKFTDAEITAILQNVGEHDLVPNIKFDPNQLKMGIKVEREHTNSDLIAALIAKDHLAEDPKYYTKLKTIEPEDFE